VTPRNTVLTGDALDVLSRLAPDSVDCVITSPPYFRARNYQAGEHELGQEATIEEWVARLLAVSEQFARVLVPTGSYWLNVGDLYSRHSKFGAPPKSLLLGPERLVRGLLDQGWIVRNRIAWVKTTPLPSPVLDRLTNSWEYVFHLVRSPNYLYDLDAIREPLASKPKPRSSRTPPTQVLGELSGPRLGLSKMAIEGRSGHVLGKNPGDVWRLPPGRRVDDHFATFPESLVRRPILATAPTRVCLKCGRPWRRSKRRVTFLAGRAQQRPLVPCCTARTRPGLVLDPFVGSGTTLKVARELGRDALGIELSEPFARLARKRAGLDPLKTAP
jgi:site-specific DNA-methyltransferase (adenine-specific)